MGFRVGGTRTSSGHLKSQRTPGLPRPLCLVCVDFRQSRPALVAILDVSPVSHWTRGQPPFFSVSATSPVQTSPLLSRPTSPECRVSPTPSQMVAFERVRPRTPHRPQKDRCPDAVTFGMTSNRTEAVSKPASTKHDFPKEPQAPQGVSTVARPEDRGTVEGQGHE